MSVTFIGEKWFHRIEFDFVMFENDKCVRAKIASNRMRSAIEMPSFEISKISHEFVIQFGVYNLIHFVHRIINAGNFELVVKCYFDPAKEDECRFCDQNNNENPENIRLQKLTSKLKSNCV